jgi:hypothetical protein
MDLSKGTPPVQVAAEMAPRLDPAIDDAALSPRPMLQEVNGKEEEQKGGMDKSKAIMTPMTNESTVLLAQFSLTRAEIGSFRQLKTSTREKDYCTCIFEQPREMEKEIDSDPSETTIMFGSVETTLLQPIQRLSPATCAKDTIALPDSVATTMISFPSYMNSLPLQCSTSNTALSSPLSTPSLPRHQHRKHPPYRVPEEQQQQHRPRRPITVWLCLACGGPALELHQQWIKRITYTTSTRLLRISVCESAFSSYEVREIYRIKE